MGSDTDQGKEATWLGRRVGEREMRPVITHVVSVFMV